MEPKVKDSKYYMQRCEELFLLVERQISDINTRLKETTLTFEDCLKQAEEES